MKTRAKYTSVLLGVAAVVAGTFAVAQPATTDEPLAAGSPTEAEPLAPESPQVILQNARLAVDKMEATADNISNMLRLARQDKDVVKTLCLDDKLSQINVAARAAADRLAIIEAGVASGSTERLSHDADVIGALSARGDELAAEGNQCIGEESSDVDGASELTLTVDPAIPEGDVAAAPTPTILSQPPQAASATL